MRILYHHRTRATDAQRVHILEMVQAFRTLGHDVEVVALTDAERTPSDIKHNAQESGWKKLVSRIPLAYESVLLGYNLVGLPWLLWKLHWTKPDFVYERYSLFNFAGVLAARLTGRPILLEVNSPFAHEQHQDREIRAHRLAAWTERVICSAATKILVVSSSLRRILVDSGVNPSRVLVLPNGLSLDRVRHGDTSNDLRESLRLTGKVVIGFVGWFKKWHGLELLLEAFRERRLGEKGAALLLVGDGPAMPDLKEYVACNGLEGSIIFAGSVPHENVAAYLDLMDIAVQPAANPYCCPMKILEYMAGGKPIVAPRQENIEELLSDGREARLFTPGDLQDLGAALEILVAEKETRLQMGRRAVEAIERRGFYWTRNAQVVIEQLGLDSGYQSGKGLSPEAKASPTILR